MDLFHLLGPLTSGHLKCYISDFLAGHERSSGPTHLPLTSCQFMPCHGFNSTCAVGTLFIETMENQIVWRHTVLNIGSVSGVWRFLEERRHRRRFGVKYSCWRI